MASQLNNDYGRDVLLQAINGNATAISQLATTLNCDINAVQASLNSLGTQVQSVGNQVGLSGQQIINAIQSGNCQITSQLASCCCDVKNLVTTQGYENRIANAENTAAIINKIDAQTTMINDKFCQLEMREMQRTIDQLRDERSALQTNISQRTQNEFIASSLYPIATGLTELKSDFECFKSHQPETISVPKDNGVYVHYNPYTVVPNCAFGYGAGLGFNNWGAWNNGCGGSLWG